MVDVVFPGVVECGELVENANRVFREISVGLDVEVVVVVVVVLVVVVVVVVSIVSVV